MAKKSKKTNLQIKLKLNLTQLDNIIILIFSENENVDNNILLKIKKIADGINIKDYEDDEEETARVLIIKKAIECIVDKNVKNVGIIVEECKNNGQYSDLIQEILEEDTSGDFSDEDIYLMDSFLSDIIQFSFISDYIDILDDYNLKIRSGDYENLHDICTDYYETVKKLNLEFSRTTVSGNDTATDFNTNENSSLKKVVSRSIKELNAPTSRLKTSIRMKNNLLNGGYEAGRFYLYLGVPGGWKSGELLNIALDIKHYNNLPVLDDGRKPVVLFVSQENSIRETLERIWSHYMSNKDEFKNHTTEEALEILNKNGFSEGTAIEFKYRKSKSIDTADVDAMIDELETKGYYVVALIHDYIKRINSTKRYPDLYTELGEVCDEWCNIAKNRNIVVISASQFNRQAYAKLEEAARKHDENALQQLGTSDIGESVKLIDNSDFIIAIHKKPDSTTGNELICYNLLKRRGKKPENAVDYFAHPFVEDNGMALQPDINSIESKSIKQTGNGLEKTTAKSIRNGGGGRPRKVEPPKSKSLTDMEEEDDDE